MEGLAAALWGLKIKTEPGNKNKELSEDSRAYDHIKKWGNRTKEDLESLNPETICKVQLDNTYQLAFNYPDYYCTLKQDNTVRDCIKEDGWNEGVIEKDNYIIAYLGTTV